MSSAATTLRNRSSTGGRGKDGVLSHVMELLAVLDPDEIRQQLKAAGAELGITYLPDDKGRFETKVRGHLGEGPGCIKEMKILNRVVRLTASGLLYEADPRHAEMLMRAVDEGANSRATPGDTTLEIDPEAILVMDSKRP